MSEFPGRQGGDVADGITLDLSTCVNPYGPPPSVISALRTVAEETIRRHPFNAAERVEQIYSAQFDAAQQEFVAARGASEALWQLRSVLGEAVGLPLPTYTEFSACFPTAERVSATDPWHTLGQLEEAARQSDAVIFSNPHNPTGRFLLRNELEGLAERYPDCVFVVDESYADFVDENQAVSLIGCTEQNVVVLRSPSKFYGMGGIRVGALWTKSESVRNAVRALRTTWPVSMLDATLLEKAFAATEWASDTRDKLRKDAAWLDEFLSAQRDLTVVDGPLHFRLVLGEGVEPFAHSLHENGVAVRLFEEKHGIGQPAMRIAAPAAKGRDVLAAATGP